MLKGALPVGDREEAGTKLIGTRLLLLNQVTRLEPEPKPLGGFSAAGNRAGS
jgi:hypothetical protein